MNKESLKKNIIDANNAYRSGNPVMTDIEYDALIEEFEQKYPDDYDDFRNSLNESSIEYGTKVKHKFIMGSLDKIKNSDEAVLSKFIKRYIKTKLNVSAKVDGISSVAHYINGKLVSLASRGDGYEGTDFTDKAPYIKGLLKEISFKDEIYVRGELVILNNESIDSNTNYRNICAGYMNTKYWKKEDISKVSFIPYTILGNSYTKNKQFSILENAGFNVAWHESVDTDIENLSAYLTNKAKLNHDYSCDGLVLMDDNDVNELDVYRPKNSMAFKINELTAITKIIDVDWSSVSKDGMICPVFILEPVEIGGAMISRASASNLDIIENLGAKYGSVVKISKANDIIPHVDEVIDNSNTTNIELPTVCPCCGSVLVRSGINLRCMNKDCKDQVIIKMTHFIKKLGCKHASEATLDNFGIYSFEDLLSFRPNQKYKSQVKFFEELEANVFNKSKRDLLAATNFCGVGEKLINKIIDFYGFDNIINGNYIGYPEGIGEAILEKFKNDVLENLKNIELIINDSRYNYLETTGSNLEMHKSLKNGMSVCFTGALNTMSRNEASKKAENAGYEVKSGVSKGLTYLVTNTPNSGSSKNIKAQKLGTKIITEEEFINLVSNLVTNDIMDL